MLHERPAVPLVVPAPVLGPHAGVVGLGVLVLDPSRGGGDGDDVENNGEEYEQGQDPPAARVGDPTAEHGRGVWFCCCAERRERDATRRGGGRGGGLVWSGLAGGLETEARRGAVRFYGDSSARLLPFAR